MGTSSHPTTERLDSVAIRSIIIIGTQGDTSIIVERLKPESQIINRDY